MGGTDPSRNEWLDIPEKRGQAIPKYSNIVKGEGKDNLSGLLIIREGKVMESSVKESPAEVPKKAKRSSRQPKNETPAPGIAGSKVTIQWEFPVETENQITGFMVSRSNSAGGPYDDVTKTALPKEARSYTDQTSLNNTYYQLRAVDKLGNEVSRSYPFLVQVEDNTPPVIPSGLTGSMDKSGIASLSWLPNTDPDIMGYRLFKSNSLKEEPVEITRAILTDLVYTDSVNIKVLNKDVYYHVIAVDKNYNASDYSKPLKLLRPDIIPPAAPIFTRSEVKKDSVILEWKNSISDDVAKYEFIKMEDRGTTLRLVSTWTQTSLRKAYTDIALTPGEEFQYKVIVYDSAGNSSEAVTRRILFESGYRKAAEELKATVNRDEKFITLQWKSEPSSVKCIVYKKINDERFLTYKTIEGAVNTFRDKGVNINNMYTYKIQLVYPNGIKSMVSKEISVTY